MNRGRNKREGLDSRGIVVLVERSKVHGYALRGTGLERVSRSKKDNDARGLIKGK